MNKAESRAMMGRMIRDKREDANLSRDDLAEKVGLSRSTIERMENGTAPVEMADFINIYAACNANPKHDFFMMVNPEIMETLKAIAEGKSMPSEKPGYKKEWQKSFKAVSSIAETLSLDELVTIGYIMSGEYGGDRYAVLQTFLAYCQLELEKRDMDCGIILNQYEDAEAKGNLPSRALKVNTAYVKRSRTRAKEAHRKGEEYYI